MAGTPRGVLLVALALAAAPALPVFGVFVEQERLQQCDDPMSRPLHGACLGIGWLFLVPFALVLGAVLVLVGMELRRGQRTARRVANGAAAFGVLWCGNAFLGTTLRYLGDPWGGPLESFDIVILVPTALAASIAVLVDLHLGPVKAWFQPLPQAAAPV